MQQNLESLTRRSGGLNDSWDLDIRVGRDVVRPPLASMSSFPTLFFLSGARYFCLLSYLSPLQNYLSRGCFCLLPSISSTIFAAAVKQVALHSHCLPILLLLQHRMYYTTTNNTFSITMQHSNICTRRKKYTTWHYTVTKHNTSSFTLRRGSRLIWSLVMSRM